MFRWSSELVVQIAEMAGFFLSIHKEHKNTK